MDIPTQDLSSYTDSSFYVFLVAGGVGFMTTNQGSGIKIVHGFMVN